ncbi:MAG: hypothetical protein JXB34_03165 [Bacteroidales bacterium]|nr:hypothetical protein [Bacteroidales bacterium]
MKKSFLVPVIIAGLISAVDSLAQQAEQKVLVSLQKGEEPMYYESCIPMSFANGNLHLVTRAGGQFYVYENGTRKGPFKNTSNIAAGNCDDATGNSSDCAVREWYPDLYDKFVKTTNDGQIKVVYNGKTYNEFENVNNIVFSENGLKIAVLGTNEEWEPLFLTPEGTIIALEGEPERIIISPNGSTAIAVIKGSETKTLSDTETQLANMQKMAEEMQSADFASMTPEQMEAFSKNLQQKYGFSDNSNSNNPDYYLYTSNGKKLGPFKFVSDGNNPAFNITGENNWYFIDDNKLFVNGTLLKNFGDSSPSACNIWLSPDGKRYAAFNGYEKLVFSDGQAYLNPLQIKAELINGKAYLTWLSLNTNNQMVLFKKAI